MASSALVAGYQSQRRSRAATVSLGPFTPTAITGVPAYRCLKHRPREAALSPLSWNPTSGVDRQTALPAPRQTTRSFYSAEREKCPLNRSASTQVLSQFLCAFSLSNVP